MSHAAAPMTRRTVDAGRDRPLQRLVLAGAGHAHAQVLLEWARAPLPGVELVLVSPMAQAPYSGMVPGWLAGTYRFDEMVIDFRALCAASGARWVAAEVAALAPDARRVQLSNGDMLAYDLLSLNIGSTLRPPSGEGARMLALRPLSLLPQAYDKVLAEWTADPSTRPWTVTAVGGGAAGVESLLAVLARLRQLRPDRPVHGGLVSQASDLLPGLSAPARRAARHALNDARVTVQLGSRWCATVGASSDLVLWATGAEAHDWQRDPARRGALAVQAQGFIRVDAQLRSISHPQVFATGDCAHWEPGEQALPKAGVVAVRMGPVLARNLRRALQGQPLETHRPQPRYLVLLATADGRAIASRGALGASGRWAWHWKDVIDRRFIRRYARADAHAMATEFSPPSPAERDTP
jgi:pyridine nucleotide-disulfide oxidoreductase family protein